MGRTRRSGNPFQLLRVSNADLRDPQTHAIIGAAMAVYQEALAIELADRGIPFQREREMPIYFKGRRLSCRYRADFVCFGEVLVEIKALGRAEDTTTSR